MERKKIIWIVGIAVIVISTLHIVDFYDRSISSTITKNYPTDGFQLIETEFISIVTPKGWTHKSGWGDDNIWGKIITTSGQTLRYDLTFFGGADNLVLCEEETIFENINYNRIITCDTNETFWIRKNSTIVEKRIENPNEYFEFIAKIEICDSIYDVEYNIDEAFYLHNFDSISINNETFKLIYPKMTGKGITGIYGGGKNFWGENLDKNTSNEFIFALETLKFKSIFTIER